MILETGPSRPSIIGPWDICYNQSETFTAFVPPNNYNPDFELDWRISAGNLQVLNSTDVRVTATTVQRDVTLEVRGFKDCYGEWSIPKILQFESGSGQWVQISGPSSVGYGELVNYSISQNWHEIDWNFPPGWTVNAGQGSPSVWAVAPSFPSYDYVTVNTRGFGYNLCNHGFDQIFVYTQGGFYLSVEDSELKPFPNPVVNTITLGATTEQIVDIQILDHVGKVVLEKKSFRTKNKISLDELPIAK